MQEIVNFSLSSTKNQKLMFWSSSFIYLCFVLSWFILKESTPANFTSTLIGWVFAHLNFYLIQKIGGLLIQYSIGQTVSSKKLLFFSLMKISVLGLLMLILSQLPWIKGSGFFLGFSVIVVLSIIFGLSEIKYARSS